MKKIFKVAQAELRSLFFSPVAWFVVISFYVVIAAVFTTMTSLLSNMQDVQFELEPQFRGFNMGMMKLIFLPICGMILKLIYLFIPLLTMGIINREIANNTHYLLYSSPLKTRDIVIGKYLAILVVNFVMLLALFILLTCGYFMIVNVEYKWFLSILLGFFLLMNTYAAIGIFISSLTRYQIVAAIITFAVFFVMENFSAIWQQYDFVRDLTWYLSISGKAELLLQGLITSREVLYFVLVILVFLGFTFIRLSSSQKSVTRLRLAGSYLLVFVVFLIFLYSSSRPGKILYKDVTQNKINTISPLLQNLLSKMDGSPLKVTLYTNLLGRYANFGLPQQRNSYVWGLWEDYQRFYPNMEFNYVYYYDMPKNDSTVYHYFPGKKLEEIVAIQADMYGVRKSLFITPEEFRQRIKLKDDDLNLIMELEYKGKKELLRMNGDNPPWPKQSTVAGTLKRLLRDKDIRVAFLSGHYERKPYGRFERDCYRHLNDKAGGLSAINMGFDADTVSVLHNDVPDDVDVLVVASPLSPLRDIETERIKKYIDKGGNAIFFTEPDKKFMLDPILQNIGVTVEDGTVVFENPHEMPHIIPSQFTQAGIMMAREKLSEESIRDKMNLTRMDFIGASNILFDSSRGFSMEPLTFSPVNNTLWVKKGVLVVDSAAPVYSSQEGDYMRENYVMAAKLSRRINNKEQRIVVASDGDFMSNLRFFNGSQGLAFYSWVLYNEYPVYVNDLKDIDNLFAVNFQTTTIVRYSLLYVLPGLMLIGAIVLLVRRNRK